MRRYLYITAFVVVGLLCAVGYAFYVQNSLRTTELTLNLGLTGLKSARPIPVPVLMAACFGTGFLLGGALFMVPWMGASRRAQALQRQVTLGQGKEANSWR